MAFTVVSIIRLGLLAAVTLFSVIVLGTAAHIISVTEATIGTYWAFVAFAIAVSVLTILTIPALVVISIIRSGAPPNYVVVELGWLFVLWVLWMASAGYSANQLSILPSGCSINIVFAKSFSVRDTINCGEFWALEAFAWLNWLILMPYTILVLIMAIIQHTRGNQRVWTCTVHQVDFFAPAVVKPGMVPQQQMYPPQPMVQQQYPGTPPQQVTPMNTGYAQPPPNVGYPPAPANTGYLPDPATTGYTQGPGYVQDPANPGYAPAPPANTGYTQGPANPAYAQV
ncbi:hypothetical protein F5887DRAFT_912914 [Amanita rubescens]|nr:hypothetical protein F5887DRAFT_912914 [Amanita rubescens]